ncbi:MAG: hypothetical protein M3R24_19705 [Chloroflexota bacterium]|nr:hypothetical protein [Chloroflexota bacterium]
MLNTNPVHLIRSQHHAEALPVDGNAVQRPAATLSEDPRQLETMVNTTVVRHAASWRTYGGPWYFQTSSAVLARGSGPAAGASDPHLVDYLG